MLCCTQIACSSNIFSIKDTQKKTRRYPNNASDQHCCQIGRNISSQLRAPAGRLNDLLFLTQ